MACILKMTEAQEQKALIQRCSYHPVARKIYAIPNDGKRSIWLGAEFKRRGLKAGMPDLCLPVARGGYHALYIELKTRNHKNHATKEQKKCIEELRAEGNRCEVAYGWEEAWDIIDDYLSLFSINCVSV